MKSIFPDIRRIRHEDIICRLDKIERLLKELSERRNLQRRETSQVIDRDGYLLTQEVCDILRISKRTLSRYRSGKKIGYYILDGKAYYKLSEIEGFMTRKGHGATAAKNQGGGMRQVERAEAAKFKRKQLKDKQPTFYQTGQVCALLGIDRKDLTKLRKKGIIRYTPVSQTSGKYNAEDVHTLINGRKSKIKK